MTFQVFSSVNEAFWEQVRLSAAVFLNYPLISNNIGAACNNISVHEDNVL